jgi:ketosteroid isomerase-like protein
MSTEQNRKAAEELFARLGAGDVAGALATMTDDATWLVAGRRESLPAAGSYNKEKLARFFHALLGRVKHGLKVTVKGTIAEGDRVALEAESFARCASTSTRSTPTRSGSRSPRRPAGARRLWRAPRCEYERRAS